MGTLAGKVFHILYQLVVVISRILAFFFHAKKLHVARFARIDELQSLLSTTLDRETSLLLGVSRFNRVLSVRPQKTQQELGNVLVVARTRGGKGLLATSQLLTWNHSVIVNDLKGDLFYQTAGYRQTLGPVYVISPAGIGHRFDPLMNRYTEDEFLSAATNLLYTPNEGEGRVFTQRASVMLTQLFLAARREGMAPLPAVRQFIRLGFPEAAERLNRLDPELATQMLSASYEKARLDNKFLLSAWETLDTKLRPILTDHVVRTFAGTDFTAEDVMCNDVPVTVYLCWSERDMKVLAPLVRLLWGSIIDELITTYDAAQGHNCHPVLLLIDEAGRTAIPSLSDYAATVCGRGISLWVAIQSLKQLELVYGEAGANILLDNMESQIYYRPSNQMTADYLERCLGRKSGFAQSETKREGVETSEGQSEQGVPLMTAWEIKQLNDEDIIGFHRRLPPFRAKRMDWRCFPHLRQRKNLPAPAVSPLPSLTETLPALTPEQPEQPVYGYFDPDRRAVSIA